MHDPATRFFIKGKLQCSVSWLLARAEITRGLQGSEGRCKEHSFESAAECEKFVESTILDLTSDGWEETHAPYVEAGRERTVDAHTSAAALPFIEACRAAPDDDGPRLVYADWLLEQGDMMGELIAVGCALAAETSKVKAKALAERERRLLTHHRIRWEGELAVLARSLSWVRGFADDLVISAAALHGRAVDVSRFAPLVRRIRIEGTLERGTSVRRIYGAPLFRTVRDLTLARGWSPPDERGDGLASWLAFASSTTIAALARLRIEGVSLTRDHVLALDAAPFARTITTLETAVDESGADALAKSVLRPECIEWMEPEVGRRSTWLGALRGSPFVSELSELRLRNSPLGMGGAQALSSLGAPLRTLRVSKAQVTEAILPALAAGGWLVNLEHLDLSSNPLGTGVRALSAALGSAASRLVSLDLSACNLTGRDVEVLADADLPRLVSLELSANQVDAAGVAALADRAKLPRLEKVRVAKNRGVRIGELRAAARGGKILLEGT